MNFLEEWIFCSVFPAWTLCKYHRKLSIFLSFISLGWFQVFLFCFVYFSDLHLMQLHTYLSQYMLTIFVCLFEWFRLFNFFFPLCMLYDVLVYFFASNSFLFQTYLYVLLFYFWQFAFLFVILPTHICKEMYTCATNTVATVPH